jgi:transcription antitermination protein NusB
MPLVDRNVLRMAIYEMIRKETPPAVVIDEALELARQFSGDESVSFINGVLDAVHRDQEAAKPASGLTPET